jgi:hypothetical protein
MSGTVFDTAVALHRQPQTCDHYDQHHPLTCHDTSDTSALRSSSKNIAILMFYFELHSLPFIFGILLMPLRNMKYKEPNAIYSICYGSNP